MSILTSDLREPERQIVEGLMNTIAGLRARVAELEAELSDAVHALNAALSRGDRHGHRVAELEAERDRWKATAEKLFREILERCNDNGGEIDAELVAEIKAAIGGTEDATRSP